MKINVRSLDLELLHKQVAAYEAQYGVPSERLFEAFTVGGVLRETEDFRDWVFLYETARDLSARCPA